MGGYPGYTNTDDIARSSFDMGDFQGLGFLTSIFLNRRRFFSEMLPKFMDVFGRNYPISARLFLLAMRGEGGFEMKKL